MSRKTLTYGLAGLLASSAIVGLVIMSNAQADPQNSMLAQRPATRTNPSQPRVMMGQMDQHFIQMMIPHHESAIAMADLALTRAKRPDIKRLAETIKQDQTREIQQMRTWYKQWYGTEVPKMSMGNMGMMGHGQGMGNMSTHSGMMADTEMQLETLRTAPDFDQAFIREMIPHHQMAVMMSQMLLNGTNRPELRSLAQSIIQSQTAEINQMRQWYQAWYPNASRQSQTR
ncbi:hypothetical protein NIES2135_63260 (plasmid) [Leptolyngbya boryana NIES-2135]|uniref:DUF305 domain-containing protein n=1 Tax=Leptolyngbya boryana NIES-2135 TaxID=1973484 RepID=A0A1Z4JRV5_LEPBY|nr:MULTISPECIES: DUF305 domain-containing protein [Leptolyngbya]BAY59449.1 hypothetical protein NIES2135_63260 [Leptolyngbya boryana NIES-2135]MBD2373032.1 DUF305 domain-containing protein [Leptolyngbya sp. FACHB-238]MBD2397214.1 DUF305 domain-containing protein [Leptolyngbya sp. FACHB-239]MBD2403980.1 DUF305 domain-containing protein [Leptolyngbya sp. FACHB-402]ULP33276.1 DUF305 domain-containing protein [Leptolyngbya boryana IU 594]